MRKFTKESGFTLMEMSVGLSLLSLMATGVLASMNGVATRYSQEYSIQRMDERARGAAREVRELLGDAGRETLAPMPIAPLGADTLDFRPAQDWVDGEQVFGLLQRLTLEIDPMEEDNGIDDDGDGLVDEQQIVFLRNMGDESEMRTIIARNVASFLEGELPNGIDDNGNGLIDERGLSLELIGESKLNIRLTIESVSEAQVTLQRTATTVVFLRN